MPKLIALVGMPGSGKSAASRHLQEKDYSVVRLGDLADAELKKQGLALGEDSERRVREGLRKEHGMDVFARLSKDRIDEALEKSGKAVVIDGLYSMQEYELIKKAYGDKLHVIAIYASPKTRHARLASRKVRPIPPEKALERDHAEIKNLN
ncbi:MAG: AAA family ATPase, partial [Candidatus Aenigmarchaeota archaeon]|nr:AAA family ATPase [Candidatus Aenigmarchaeota archaeon]